MLLDDDEMMMMMTTMMMCVCVCVCVCMCVCVARDSRDTARTSLIRNLILSCTVLTKSFAERCRGAQVRPLQLYALLTNDNTEMLHNRPYEACMRVQKQTPSSQARYHALDEFET